jgi:Ca2+-binding RTX toxin-like protein
MAVVALGVAVAGAAPAMKGTKGDDTLTGTDHFDLILAFAGNDTVNALGGPDVVIAGRGNDTVHGGDGPDLIFGRPGDDTIYGENGNDRIFVGLGVDTEYGGPGNDDLWALARGDVTGQPNEPADTLDGGPGNDVFHTRDGEPDHIDCGDGFDVVKADFKDVVAANCEVVKRHKPGPRFRRHGPKHKRSHGYDLDHGHHYGENKNDD